MDAAITPLALKARLAAVSAAHARRRAPATGLRAESPDVIPGAIRRLPDAVDAWAAPLEPWRPVVVYCVRGHEVSQNAATALRARGLDTRYLEGGLEHWRAESFATQAATQGARRAGSRARGQRSTGSRARG